MKHKEETTLDDLALEWLFPKKMTLEAKEELQAVAEFEAGKLEDIKTDRNYTNQ